MPVKGIALIACATIFASGHAASAADDPTAAPTTGAPGAVKAGDPKPGTSPPIQAGGAGVKGKSDAGAGTTKGKEQ